MTLLLQKKQGHFIVFCQIIHIFAHVTIILYLKKLKLKYYGQNNDDFVRHQPLREFLLGELDDS